MFRRILTYITLACCLLVGTFVVRMMDTTETELSFNTVTFDHLSSTKLASAPIEPVELPEVKFANIEFPKPKPVIVAKKSFKAPKTLLPRKLAPNELPFHEPVELSGVYFDGQLINNVAALYNGLPDFKQDELVATTIDEKSDVVTTTQAKDEVVAEPEFFEYKDEAVEPEQVVATQTEVNPTVEEINTTDIIPQAADKEQKPVAVTEEVGLDDLVAFDYPKANQDLASQAMPTVSVVTGKPVTTQTNQPTRWVEENKPKQAKPVVTTQALGEPQTEQESLIAEPSQKSMPAASQTVIQAIGTDLKGNEPLNGFEIRYHDDYSEMSEDYGNGEIVLENNLANDKMTRSIRLIKREFATTNTEIILEKEGATSAIPLINSQTFDELMSPYASNGPIGAVLVELDDEAELAQLDVPFVKVITLDGDLKETSAEDHRYQLFVGVRAGNAMLTYKTHDRQSVSKIIHVHMNELTFDNNFFEEKTFNKVKLQEEDLLSKEPTPLIIASEQVKIFASEVHAKKINDHTFKLNFDRGLLGGRRYLELLHQSEPVFVGVRNKQTIQIPSENFMRHILTKTSEAKLANRCLVQVNLSKKALAVEVGAESVDSTLMTSVQMLDRDGKFYDSLSDKTRKVIIMGESHASEGTSPDGKINLKIEYQDGSIEYLNSYCSPNSYMVEQL